MTNPSTNNNSTEKWWLGAQLPPLPNSAAPVTFNFDRRILEPELTEVRNANDFLMHVAAVATYARLFDLLQKFQAATVPAKNISVERRALNMNHSGRILVRAVKEFPAEMRRQVGEDFGVESPESRGIKVAVIEECARLPYRITMQVADLDEDVFKAASEGVIIDPPVLQRLRQAEHEIPQPLNLVQVITNAVLVCQRIVAKQLKIYQAKISAASLIVRRVAAEIPDGVPLILRADNLDSPNLRAEGLGPFTQQALALDSALALHRAIRQADALLRIPVVESQTGLEHPVADVANEGEPLGEEVENSGGPQPTTDSTGKAEEQPAEEQPAEEQPSVAPGDQALDLMALAGHAVDLADSLERAWSDALSSGALAPAHQEMEARVSSFVAAIQRRVSATTADLQKNNIDTGMGPIPPSREEIQRLSYEPDPIQRWRQAQAGQIDALVFLLNAFNAMRAPSGRKLDLLSGKSETWWEAGSYAMLRARARLLRQLSYEMSAAAESLLGRDVGDEVEAHRPFDALMLASERLSQGDALGAVLEARHAIMQQASIGNSHVPDDLIVRLAADPQLVRESPVLQLMQETAERFLLGRDINYAVPVIIAPLAIQVAQRVCLAEPQRVQAACQPRGAGETSTGDVAPASRAVNEDMDEETEKP
jgi:hypothetical protein